MKFGLLKITTPDGRTREYPLDLPWLVIGRADGNSILVDDLSVARRHARLTIDSGHLLIEDLGSATGTFIGGERIPPNTPSLVDGHQDIRIGDVGIVFEAPPEMAITPATTVGPAHLALPPLEPVSSLEMAPTVRAVLSVPPTPIEPGSEATELMLTVYNRGQVVDQLTLEVIDVPAEWVHMSSNELVLLPGHQQDVHIAIQVPRTPAARAGVYDFSVAVTSGETGRQVVSAGQLTVLPFDELELTVHPVRSKRNFVLKAQNRGNAMATHTVAAQDDEDAFRYEFDAPTLVVAPGDEQSLHFRVIQKHRHMLGMPAAKPFNVVVTPTTGGEKVKAGGQLDVRPPLQPYKRPLVMTAALALVAIGLLAFFFLSSDNTVKTASAESAYAGVHMCDKSGGSSSSTPSSSNQSTLPTPTLAPATSSASSSGGSTAGGAQIPAGADKSVGGPYFAQNDPRWGSDEYAHAKDPTFGGNDWCGNTIAQCGCAMTSVTTMLALFNLVVMPDGSPLDPQTVNNWFNEDATKTSRGWVSQGYSYGDVIWTAANQLSGEIAKKYPGTKTVKYMGRGTGSDDEIRTQLKMGNPVVLEVPGHFIAAVGVSGDKILINDPFYRDRTTLDAYKGKVLSSRLFAPATDLSAVVITVPADTRVKITDKQGRTVGTLDTSDPADAAKSAANGIPGASYSNQAAWRDPTCVESAPPPGSGTNQIVLPGNKDDYTIQVLDTTGAATSVAIHSYGADGSPVLTTIPVASGAATAQMSYDPNSDATKVNVVSNTIEAQSDSARAAGQTQTASASTATPATPAKGTPTPAATATATAPAIVQTTLSTAAASGATVVNVSNQTGFKIDDLIRVSPGAANQEDVAISGFGSSGFILKGPLKFAHSAGELVIRLGAAAPAGPTPTPAPPPAAQLAAPSNVGLSCSTIYNGVMPPPAGQPPPTATLICSAAISGTYTTTRWTLDGQVQSQYTGKPVLLAVYNINTTVGVGVAGCNVTLCTSASAAQTVAFPVNTAAPTPTPAPPPPSQGPIGPPPVVNTANIACQPQPFTGSPNALATLKCSSSTSMTNFTSVTFKATGTTLPPAVTNVTGAIETFQLQVKPTDVTPVNGVATVPVVVTYCQQATCATSDAYNWVIPFAQTTLTLLPAPSAPGQPSLVAQGGVLSLFAVLVTSNGVIPSGGSVSFFVTTKTTTVTTTLDPPASSTTTATTTQGFGTDVKLVTGVGFASLAYSIPAQSDPNLAFGLTSSAHTTQVSDNVSVTTTPSYSVTAQYNGGSNVFPGAVSSPGLGVTVLTSIAGICDSLPNDPGSPVIDAGCTLPGTATKDLGNGTLLGEIAISGNNQSNNASINVPPGGGFTVSANVIRDPAASDSCADCDRQVYFGIGANTASVPPVPAAAPTGGTVGGGTCVFNAPIPTTGTPGLSTGSISFAAPTTPGVYYIRATSSLQPGCGQPDIGGPSSSIARVVVQATTATTLSTPPPSPAALGTKVSMAATVNVTSGGATGTLSGFVEFCDADTTSPNDPGPPCAGGTILATVPVVPSEGSPSTQGTASFTLDTSVLYDGTLNPSPVKTHHLSAHFIASPSAGVFPVPYYLPSDSAASTLVINPSVTTIGVTVTPGTAVLGSTVVMTAGLASQPQFGPLSGTVTFLVDGVGVTTVDVNQNGLTLATFTYDTTCLFSPPQSEACGDDGEGTASPVKAHSITAQYTATPGGNYSNADTSAAPQTLTTTAAPTNAQIKVVPANPNLGTLVEVTAAVYGPGFGQIGQAGDVSFTLNGQSITLGPPLLYTTPAFDPSGAGCPVVAPQCSLWTGSFDTSTLYNSVTNPSPTGSSMPYNFAASFNPSGGNYLSASSPSTQGAMELFPAQTTTTITTPATPQSVQLGSITTIAAHVTQNSPNGPFGSFTGTMSFVAGSGSPNAVTLCPSAPVDASGNATCAADTSLLQNVGTYQVTATFLGGGNYQASPPSANSPDITLTPATTTLGLTVNPTTQVLGQSVTLQAAITPNPPLFGNYTGSVTFYLGEATVGTATVQSDGTASLTVDTADLPVSPRAGPQSFAASWPGQSNYLAPANGGPATLTVTPAPVTVSIGASPTQTTAGNTVTFTATVTSTASGTISGTVTFCDTVSCATPLGTGTLSGGVATLSTTALPGGQSNVYAKFPATGDFQGGQSSPVTVTVLNPTATSFTLTPPGPTISTTSANIAFAVTVVCPSCSSGGDFSGTANVFDQAAPTVSIGSASISSGGTGTVNILTSSLTVGSHTFFVRYHGGATTTFADSDSPTQTVNIQAPSATTITSPASSPTTAGATTLTANVTSGGNPINAVGTVQFNVDGTDVGAPQAVNASGNASLAHTFAPGSHVIKASYTSGGATGKYADSTVSSTVQYQSGTTVTLTPSVGGTTPTALDTASYTALVTANVGGGATPSGTIQFTIDGVNQGSPVTLDGTGSATLSAYQWHFGTGTGAHTVGATFTPATADYLTSSATPLAVTVSQITTSISISGSPTVSAVVTCGPPHDCSTLTGNVVFSDSQGTPATQSVPVTAGVTGTASFTYTATGNHKVSAVFQSTNTDFATPASSGPPDDIFTI